MRVAGIIKKEIWISLREKNKYYKSKIKNCFIAVFFIKLTIFKHYVIFKRSVLSLFLRKFVCSQNFGENG